jgi:hypothetical protein
VFDVEVWLVAIAVDVPDDEIRRYWNVKETPVLDEIIAASPAFRLGTTEAPYPGNETRAAQLGGCTTWSAFAGR